MLVDNIWYSITINPSDDYQLWDDEYRLTAWYSYFVKNLVNLLNKVSRFELYPEMSDSGRLHLHGSIIFHDVFKYKLEIVRPLQRMSNIDIDDVKFGGDWDMYIRKQSFNGGAMHLRCIERFLPYPVDNYSINEMVNIDDEEPLRLLFYDNPQFKRAQPQKSQHKPPSKRPPTKL